MSDADALRVRAYVDADFDEIAARWHETNLASFFYVAEHPRHTLVYHVSAVLAGESPCPDFAS